MDLTAKLHWLRKHAVTTILLVGYLFMAMLIMEQGDVIANQNKLIRQLYSDSIELNASKMRHAVIPRR